jgi:hypothetical protein
MVDIQRGDWSSDVCSSDLYLEEKKADSLWQNTYFQRDIAENTDYLLVNEDIWEFFVGIYGCDP